jgi:hypothetical protein
MESYNNVIRQSLENTVPARITGKRQAPIMLDYFQDLLGFEPSRLCKVALSILNVQETISQMSRGHNPKDVEIYAGELAPVPFLFLLGNALEDERPIHWVEYDRIENKWAWSHEGAHVDIWGYQLPNTMPSNEVVIKAGITYPIAEHDTAKAFHNLPVVVWEPLNKLLQKVIDEESCIQIAKEFKALVMELHTLGISKIHLLLACSSALTMRLGSVIDPRNMPLVIVYQYERTNPLIYPWGIGVETMNGVKTPILEVTNNRI